MPKKKTQPKPWYSVNALGSDSAEIYLYGDIGENYWEPEKSHTAEQLIEELSELKGKSITVRMNSVGGSVVDGIAIYNAFKRHRGGLTVEIDAVAYSAASLIAMAGDTVSMAANALLMIHAPWNLSIGNAQKHRHVADVLDKYSDAMMCAYVRDSGPDVETIERWLKDGDDHYFTASEALEYGLIDNITDQVDIAAHVRGFDLRGFESPDDFTPAAVAACKPQEALTMPTMKTQAANHTPADPKSQSTKPAEPVNVVDIETKARVKRDEELKARNEELLNIFSLHSAVPGMSDLKDQIMIDPTITLDAARELILNKLGEGAEPVQSPAPYAVPGQDSSDKRIEAMTKATLSRVGIEKQDRQNPYRGLSLSGLARECLAQSGVNVRGMQPEEFAPLALSPIRAAQTRSDFPIVLENTLHQMVLNGFQAVAPTYQRVAKIGDVTDFRDWNRLVPGVIGNLDDVDEHGNYRDKALPDAQKNTISASRKGNIVSITPEILVDDNIGYVMDLANSLGMAGPRTIDRAFYTLLESNPVLSDGVALFHADHGNLATAGAAPSNSTLNAAATAMALQTAPGDDAEILDISTEIAVLHRALWSTMFEVVNAEYNDETSKNQRKPNSVRNIVSDIVSTGRLSSTTAWYIFANPMINPVIEVVFLNGQREPRVVMEENFRSSGLSWKVELPFGVGAIDYRGAYKNGGA
jgi:ATP-dependent protease ClpP protease subunit